jgi:hypothetical protein
MASSQRLQPQKASMEKESQIRMSADRASIMKFCGTTSLLHTLLVLMWLHPSCPHATGSVHVDSARSTVQHTEQCLTDRGH